MPDTPARRAPAARAAGSDRNIRRRRAETATRSAAASAATTTTRRARPALRPPRLRGPTSGDARAPPDSSRAGPTRTTRRRTRWTPGDARRASAAVRFTPWMNTPHLARIAYASALCDEPRRGELDALASAWRRHNAQHGITGLLLQHAGSVFQVIEGFPEDVVRLYEAIARDRRHRCVTQLIHEPASQRWFGD